jgi:methionyl-tRNA formyltransferase
MSKLRVVIFGTPDFAVASLAALLEEPSCEVVGVVTAPDRLAGRGNQLTPSPVKEFALAHRLPISQPEKLKDPKFIEALAAMRPDLNAVVAFRMLPEVVWALPPLGSVNLHASLLPDYRGAAPIHWAVINGERRTGLTTFQLAHEIDTGGILLQREVAIPESATTGDIYPIMQQQGADLLAATVRGLADRSISPSPQNGALAIHLAPKLTPENTRIDWNRPAKDLAQFVRGLSPSPAAWCMLGGQQMKLFRSDSVDFMPSELEGATPGTPFVAGKQLFVATARGALLPTVLQLQGKRQLPVADFINGYGHALTNATFT